MWREVLFMCVCAATALARCGEAEKLFERKKKSNEIKCNVAWAAVNE